MAHPSGNSLDLAALAPGVDPPTLDLPEYGRRRQGLDPEVVHLVLRLARENPRWGYLRIVGECRKLGVRVLAWDRRHLERVLTAYVDHYNSGRPHRGIDLDTPVTSAEPPPASIEQLQRVKPADVLGGLIHEYRHVA